MSIGIFSRSVYINVFLGLQRAQYTIKLGQKDRGKNMGVLVLYVKALSGTFEISRYWNWNIFRKLVKIRIQ